MSKRVSALVVLAVWVFCVAGVAQQSPEVRTAPGDAAASQVPAATTPPAETIGTKAPNKAAAYYHFMQAHMYEELVALYGRAEYANKAIQEYRLAIENDPSSEYLNAGLAELYAKTGRIRDAVLEAQDILKRDPNNLETRKLLGRIYLRSLGDVQSGAGSQDMLKHAIEQYEAIVKIEPRNVENHLLLGRLYRLNNDLTKAENEFKGAVKLQPDSEEAVTTLAYLYNEEGDTQRAAEVLSTIPDAARTGRLYQALGFTYEQQKEYKKAISAYSRAVELDRDNLDAMRGLAQNLMNDGQTDAALQQYKAIIDADPQDPQSYLRIAEIYRRSGKFDQALDALKKAQLYVQDSLEVPYNLAVIYQAQGKFDEAAQIVQGLVQKGERPDGNYSASDRNNRAVFLERLGSIYRDAGKTPLAVETFRKMLALGDENASRGYEEIIDAYRDAKQYQQATAVAKEAVAKLPQDRSLKLTLASLQAEIGPHPDAALADIKAMLKGTPDDREVYITLGQVNTRLKRWKDAEEALAKAQQLSSKPEEKNFVEFAIGSMYERQKKYDAAEQSFKKVLANDQRNAMTLNYLGYMLADRGVRLDEALGYIKQAVTLDPQNGAYLDSLGWVQFKLGNYDLAEENLRRASERMNNDPTIHDHLAELYAKTGRLKIAVAHWERALQEWNRSAPADVDTAEMAKVQKKLENAKVKLARQGERKAEATKP
ncbi:MAG: tetratricopeptide repeat protein [Terriglobales bacterium]